MKQTVGRRAVGEPSLIAPCLTPAGKAHQRRREGAETEVCRVRSLCGIEKTSLVVFNRASMGEGLPPSQCHISLKALIPSHI